VNVCDLDKAEVTRRFAAYCEQRAQVLAGYIFGSFAHGKAGPLSDLDLALLMQEPVSGDELWEFRKQAVLDLMSLFHTDDVDVVLLNEAPPLLAHRATWCGDLAYSRDERERVAFEVRALQRYCDMVPVWNLFERALYARIENGTFGRDLEKARGR